MNKIDVQQTGGFPLETDTLDFMQSGWNILNALGYISGNSVILQGCTEYMGNVSAGYLFFNGEVFRFDGGALGTEIRVVETVEERIFEDGISKPVYKTRKAVFGTPGIPWSVFKRPKSAWDLTNTQNGLAQKTVPVGAIMMWAGAINAIPTGWYLCDGTNSTPDLRSKFIVGYNPGESDYDTVGKTGGAKSVILTEAQMPKHTHGASTDTKGAHTHSGLTFKGSNADNGDPGALIVTNSVENNGTQNSTTALTGSAGGHNHLVTVEETGGDSPHENRPPYYTLAFIQFKNI